MQYIKRAMSDECRYDMSQADQKCQGCKHMGSGKPHETVLETS
jgi:hypothetical protein